VLAGKGEREESAVEGTLGLGRRLLARSTDERRKERCRSVLVTRKVALHARLDACAAISGGVALRGLLLAVSSLELAVEQTPRSTSRRPGIHANEVDDAPNEKGGVGVEEAMTEEEAVVLVAAAVVAAAVVEDRHRADAVVEAEEADTHEEELEVVVVEGLR
jgi:hypothetical protein